jgi:ABC-2 type transport system ATP-binding protein
LREHNRRRKTTILLTSHYMADIQELCDRVIIIDRGTVFFDGRLAEILDRFAGFKIITVTLEQASGFASVPLAELGEVLEQSSALARLKVPRESVIATCKVLLDRLPVKDFAVEEVPIEDIIRQVFERR